MCLFCFLLLLAACKHDPRPGEILRRLAPPKQIFHLKTGRDTTITCKKGTILKFCANTFQTTAAEIVLEVQEVNNRADMIRNGLSTVTTDGHLLASEGMIYLNVQPPAGTTINPDCPVQVEMPVDAINAFSGLFEGQTDGLITRWKNPQPLSEDPAQQQWAMGKALFCYKCAACHSYNLSYDLAGPALGNITDWRDQDWLHTYTRNSQRMTNQGDSLAICLWDKWKPAAMPNYNDLSDEDINAIYAFITMESKRQKVNRAAGEFRCDWKSYPSDSSGMVRATVQSKNQRVRPNRIPCYYFPVSRLGWVNVDYFLSTRDDIPVVPFWVEIKDDQRYDDLTVALVFDAQQVNMQLDDLGNGFGFQGKPEAPLPPVAAHIYAIGLRGNRFYSAVLPVTLSTNNHFVIDLQSMAQKDVDTMLKPAEAPVKGVIDWCKFILEM